MQLPVLNNTPAHAEHGAKGGCAASSCGTTENQMDTLPDSIREKVQNHPCYSEDAHHYFARMHVAVAPACNIQSITVTVNTIAPTNPAPAWFPNC